MNAARTPNSGSSYKFRLQAFAAYVYRKLDMVEVDIVVEDLLQNRRDPYDLLQTFLNYLKTDRKELSANVMNAIVRTTKKFLKFSRVKIDNEEFSDRVQLLLRRRPVKQGIEKRIVVDLLNACKDIRLKTFVLGCASLGPRPIELCAVRNRDINFERNEITFRAEFSKVGEAGIRPLTQEFAKQAKLWYEYKHRTRRTTVNEKRVIITPQPSPDDLFFSKTHYEEVVSPKGVYEAL